MCIVLFCFEFAHMTPHAYLILIGVWIIQNKMVHLVKVNEMNVMDHCITTSGSTTTVKEKRFIFI